MVKEARREGAPLLVLDAGNSLVGDIAPATTTKGASTIEAMNLIGYDAMALGPDDLRLGADVLKARAEEAEFPLLSANAVISVTGELLASPYVVREVGGRRVGIVGITGDYRHDTLPDIRVLDPVTVTQQVVPELREDVDIVILLSSAGHATDVSIAGLVPGIDLVVEGGPFISFGRATFVEENRTLLIHADYASTGHAGRRVGKVILGFDEDDTLIGYDWQVIELGPEIASDPRMLNWRAQYR